MAGRLQGRVALVTGAGRGIGRATALRLASEGARVAVVTRGAASGEETIAAIVAGGGEARLIVADMADRAQLRAAATEAAGLWGALDIVIQNAAATTAMPIDRLDDAALDAAIDLNLKSAFWLLEETLPSLHRSDVARLLLVSSITGNRISNVGYAVYGATKAGINGFIRQAAAELGPMGVRVNGVEPGITLTPSVAGYLGDDATRLAEGMPLGRITAPEDIAAVLAFLASDDAAQITGQTIVVDAGQSLGATTLGGDR